MLLLLTKVIGTSTPRLQVETPIQISTHTVFEESCDAVCVCCRCWQQVVWPLCVPALEGRRDVRSPNSLRLTFCWRLYCPRASLSETLRSGSVPFSFWRMWHHYEILLIEARRLALVGSAGDGVGVAHRQRWRQRSEDAEETVGGQIWCGGGGQSAGGEVSHAHFHTPASFWCWS